MLESKRALGLPSALGLPVLPAHQPTALPQGAMGAGANGFDTVKMLKTLRIIRSLE